MRKTGKARWEAMDRQEVDLSTLIEIFETHNRTEGKSLRTVGWYNEVLKLLYCWLREEDLPTALATLDEMTVRRFILYLQNRPGLKGEKASSHTVYNRVNALDCGCEPYVDVFTYNRWKAQGFQVQKGMKSINSAESNQA